MCISKTERKRTDESEPGTTPNLDKSMKAYYWYFDELALLASIYVDILDFLYGIRFNSTNLKIADFYNFSDGYLMMVIT